MQEPAKQFLQNQSRWLASLSSVHKEIKMKNYSHMRTGLPGGLSCRNPIFLVVVVIVSPVPVFLLALRRLDLEFNVIVMAFSQPRMVVPVFAGIPAMIIAMVRVIDSPVPMLCTTGGCNSSHGSQSHGAS
jgi:hypothetical protein